MFNKPFSTQKVLWQNSYSSIPVIEIHLIILLISIIFMWDIWITWDHYVWAVMWLIAAIAFCMPSCVFNRIFCMFGKVSLLYPDMAYCVIIDCVCQYKFHKPNTLIIFASANRVCRQESQSRGNIGLLKFNTRWGTDTHESGPVCARAYVR